MQSSLASAPVQSRIVQRTQKQESARTEITRLATFFSIPDKVRERALVIFDECVERSLLRKMGANHIMISRASLYIASREMKFDIPFNKIANESHLQPLKQSHLSKMLRHCYLTVINELGISIANDNGGLLRGHR